jgi:hypothetical protein
MRDIMKQLTAIICFSVLCLAFSASAAEDPAGFSGTWIQDMKESDATPHPIMDLGAPTNVEGGMGGGFPGGMGGGFPGGMGGGFPGGKPGQPAAEPAPLVIQQTESEIQIKNMVKGMGGADTPIVESYKLDGKELVEMVPAPNSPKPLKRTTKVSLKKNKFQVKQTTATPQGDNEIKRDYSLSKDGKKLTLNIKTTIGMGLVVMQTVQKLVYNRQ